MSQKSRVFEPAFASVRPAAGIIPCHSGRLKRAFQDLQFDVMKDPYSDEWGFAIVRMTGEKQGGNIKTRHEPPGTFGHRPNEIVEATRFTRTERSVLDGTLIGDHWSEVLALARHPHIIVVTSGLPDVEMELSDWDLYEDSPPASFPAKLTRLLHERWKYLGHTRDLGRQFRLDRCIEYNSETIAGLVQQQARIWGLEPVFISWLKSHFPSGSQDDTYHSNS